MSQLESLTISSRKIETIKVRGKVYEKGCLFMLTVAFCVSVILFTQILYSEWEVFCLAV